MSKAFGDRGAQAAEFYMEEHAALYALLVKHAAVLAGEAGRLAAEKATILYGRERGLRMAMRCRADGKELTPNHYLDYGEWADDRQHSDFRVKNLNPFILEAHGCGWKNSWEKHGLTAYGSLYCRLIDAELVRGFNPSNKLLMDGALTLGAARCTFHFIGAAYANSAELEAAVRERARLRPRTVKDFLFHCGHVLSAFRSVLLTELGLVAGERIVQQSLQEFAAIFGPDKAEALKREAEQDFLQAR
jgi:hypothetical protein